MRDSRDSSEGGAVVRGMEEPLVCGDPDVPSDGGVHSYVERIGGRTERTLCAESLSGIYGEVEGRTRCSIEDSVNFLVRSNCCCRWEGRDSCECIGILRDLDAIRSSAP